MDQVTTMLRALDESGFPHPVAIRQGRDAELGAVLEADALDVPPTAVMSAHERLADVLWPCAFTPMTVLPSAFDTTESVLVRAGLPAGTVWYLPRPKRSSRS